MKKEIVLFISVLIFTVVFTSCRNSGQINEDTRYKSKGINMSQGVIMIVGNDNKLDQTNFIIPKDSIFCNLTLAEQCTLKILTDNTVCALKQGIIAKDSAGVIWESKKIMLESTEIYAFFKKP